MELRYFIGWALIGLITFSLSPLWAQDLQGRLLDKSGAPISGAHIYISNTTIGTTTDQEGYFDLKSIPEGEHSLIMSHIAFMPLIQPLRDFENNEGQRIIMEDRVAETAEVTISSGKSNKRKRWLKSFNRGLLGITPFARSCEIENPSVILFWETDGALQAKAEDLIRIRNGALGYRIFFLLEHFRMEGREMQYAGKPLFEELSPTNDKERLRWEKNRETAHQGSREHFFRSLLAGNCEEEGFEIYHARLRQGNQFEVIGPARPANILKEVDGQMDLHFQGFLQVVFTKEKGVPSMATSSIGNAKSTLGRPAEKDMIDQEANQFRAVSDVQSSFLYLIKSEVGIDPSGRLKDPSTLKEYGYWTSEGLADLLPLEVEKSSVPDKQKQPEPSLNGFTLSDLRIPLEEIYHGGPPRDGIPSIDHPVFHLPASSDIRPRDQVLGVVYNGVAKAYPIRIMDWHEIVNDEFDGNKVVVTYCPLCGSGMSFEADINSQSKTFGVSGLLYNSDVLLYDRETESLWSQIKSEAVSGPESGTMLKLVPTYFTTWGEWEKRYPASLVLSSQTGFDRDYSHSPYNSYEWDQQLMFPVSKESEILKRKDKVIGVTVNGKHKAYPIKSLNKSDQSTWQDVIGDKKLSLIYDASSEVLIVTDRGGQVVPSTTMYWFAWYAFHPDTEVF